METTGKGYADGVAVAHKDYDVRGGGEILAERMAGGLDAPLYVGHGNGVNQPDHSDVSVYEIGKGSKWHALADRGGLPRAIAHMMLWRDHADKHLRQHDTVITSGNEPLWWTPREWQTWVAYTHSTPRWLYDLYNEKDGWLPRTADQLKRWIYEQDMTGPDLWVANSDIVARRMRRYWDIPDDQIRVVYPPIDTERLSPDNAPTQDYYLSLGRLSGLKCVDTVIKTANRLDKPLKVAGTGPEEEKLKQLAAGNDNVEMLGWVEGERKRELLAGAKAVINASQNEDFGMVVVEALASGTPVLTKEQGMPQHTVKAPEMGHHWKRGQLAGAINRFEDNGVECTPEHMARWTADNFGVERFVEQMTDAVRVAREENEIDDDIPRPAAKRGVADD